MSSFIRLLLARSPNGERDLQERANLDHMRVVRAKRLREVRVPAIDGEEANGDEQAPRRPELHALAAEPRGDTTVDADELVPELDPRRRIGARGAELVVAVGVGAEESAFPKP